MGEPLPLWPGAKACQRTGWCCEQGPCGFGSWDHAAHRCTELLYDADGKTSCRRYAEILALNQPLWAMSPVFGVGCCSPLNPKRAQLGHKIRGIVEIA